MTTTTMRTARDRLAVCATVALLAGTAACTSGGDGRATATGRPTTAAPSATACAGGAYAWSDVVERAVLTGVADRQVLGAGGGKLTEPLRRVHTPRTAVDTESGPKADPVATLRSLGARVGGAGEDDAFADPGQPAPDLGASGTDVDGAGTFVWYAYVREVTGAFRLTCPGGEPSTGTAVGWSVDGTGVLDCDEPRSALEDSEAALAAARASCGDAPAARG
ncbi:hypothetical protein [Streptomyces sp. NPDC057854]|uniref:hypothetical protein n=1 Tax=unclassified Streptomyces TaxID=2593676 RepID=UPI0036CF3659